LGKSERFQDINKSPQPGPSKYYIEGFADKLLKENNRKAFYKTKKTQKALCIKEPSETKEAAESEGNSVVIEEEEE